MTMKELQAKDLMSMFLAGASYLSRHASQVDALNVFPVPDGDTGTNMNLTISSGALEIQKRSGDQHAGKLAQAFSKGLLMGARGNSGVILSQLFRGFSKVIAEEERISAPKLAQAFSQGVSMAYDAVMKPVEGTILTVAREAAAGAVKAAQKTDDVVSVMKAALEAAEGSLARTPDLLPVLKEVGVVDSGGQGLVIIYQGFFQALSGDSIDLAHGGTAKIPTELHTDQAYQAERAQLHTRTEDIHYGYCTEFLVRLKEGEAFQLASFRESISRFGDSLLVVADEDLVKIHIHSELPGEVLSFGQQFGELIGIKIENMREQHSHIVEQDRNNQEERDGNRELSSVSPLLPYGVVAVAMGDGITKVMKSLGVDEVVAGGQSMNPSTEDLMKAASRIQAEHVIFLPNNKNVILAAEQAAKLLSIPSTVIPSRSIPQGMAAMLAFCMDESPERNKKEMVNAISRVKTGQVTYAVRDTKLDQLQIKEGDFLGMAEGEIVTTGQTLEDVALQLLSQLVAEDDEIITVFYGEEVQAKEAENLAHTLEELYPDREVELHHGGQPLYSYIFSVE